MMLSMMTYAQNAEDSVKAVINAFFKGMIDGNPEPVKAGLSDSAIFQTVVVSKQGETRIVTQPVADFVQFVATLNAGDADERIEFETIKIDGNLAMVWTPYQFYFKGKFSHCGVNSFHLVRHKGKWVINYLIDTRQKSPCKQ